MGREWQQTRFKEYVMPDPVYYQAIWCVRDLVRMEARLKELKKLTLAGNIGSSSMVKEQEVNYQNVRPTEKIALEMANLEFRVKGINEAIKEVPRPYRQMIMDNIILKTSSNLYPNKVWKIWKQKFLFNVARNLSLM